ncbi:hypothetical protein [Staphylococcus gallinarum]|uniref:hypothetical protein n=1 Tax=Staphylococcus gallinarum TaxID=1293 RepID=UPI001E3BAB03|nr:hypothetical protein [Staphylococcus gallinarum]MCD8845171.1 hypothetical protein [Staphylococcus gallinarum]
MNELYAKKKANKELLSRLSTVIEGGQLTIEDETIDIQIIKKELTNNKGQDKVFYTIDHEEFPESYNVIRLYLPLMGDGGYVPTEEEVKQLFSGNIIHPPENAFLSSKGKPYSVESIKFNPLAENVTGNGKKLNFYGEMIPQFSK